MVVVVVLLQGALTCGASEDLTFVCNDDTEIAGGVSASLGQEVMEPGLLVVLVREDLTETDGCNEHFDADEPVLETLGDILGAPVVASLHRRGQQTLPVECHDQAALGVGEEDDGLDGNELANGPNASKFCLKHRVELHEAVHGPHLTQVVHRSDVHKPAIPAELPLPKEAKELEGEGRQSRGHFEHHVLHDSQLARVQEG
mmetsp:Transcript_13209/g.38379  ORF Transcript_13209/g.38379 Transcript_13209/m.38379 type:complete len:201 (-) Transcript_13209:709-1311(-)